MRFKAVAFDLDGTLVNEPSSWYTIHKHFGTYDQSKKNMAAYETGEIDYQEFMRRDISLWQPVPHLKTLNNILDNFTLTKNAQSAIQTLSEKGIELFIITTAPEFFARSVASKLEIKQIASNSILFDERGFVTQKTIFNVDLLRKELAFESLITQSSINCKECIAVGDSKYDRGFLAKAGLGVAFNPTPDCSIREDADYIIDDMQELLQFV
jgi:HAD superfamily PSPase-like hydrolase